MESLPKSLDPNILAAFPKLRCYHITSPQAIYNCIAWAAGHDEFPWWPYNIGVPTLWPKGAPRNEKVEAFTIAFSKLGYETCEDGSLESGFEKVAIYEADNAVTHMARQLDTGMWTSKLGPNVDIEHNSPADLEDGVYGKVVRYMKRPFRQG